MSKTLANLPFAISPQKLFSFTRYLSFCLDFLVMYQNGLIKKKNYDVTVWIAKGFQSTKQ